MYKTTLAPTHLKIPQTKEMNILYFANPSNILGFGCHYNSPIEKKNKQENKQCPNEFETFFKGNDSDYPAYDPNISMPVKQNEEVQEKEEKEKNDKQGEREKEDEEEEEEYGCEAKDEQQSSQVHPSEDMSEEQLEVQYIIDNNLYCEEGEDDRKQANIDMRKFSDIKATACNQLLWLVDGNLHFIIENVQGQWSKKVHDG